MLRSLFSPFLLFSSIFCRQYLPENRVAHWQLHNDPNIGPLYGQPEQVHLSYNDEPGSYTITWLTYDDTLESGVEYGTDIINLSMKSQGRCSLFNDEQKNSIRRFIHRVRIEGLQPRTRYYYHVGSQHGWSPVFYFTTLPEKDIELAVYGDLGVLNARSMGFIQQLAQKQKINMVLHVGDFAYNMDEDNGENGDEFFRQIESIAAYVPYMTAVGNHEQFHNFTHYVNRLTMPNTDDNLFYSFDIGPAHIIVFSTEFYFFTNYGFKQIENQYNWLLEDLKRANTNRHKTPWLITMAHRPMYCSDFDGDDCTKFESIVRTGLPLTHAYALEKLFYDQGVDLELWAHEHTYERLWPVFNRTVFNGTHDPYNEPPAPVHIITGSAGCRENTDVFVEHPPPWSARRSTDYGFGSMTICNSTHLRFRQFNVAKGGLDDDFYIVKSKHRRHYSRRDHRRLKTYGHYVPLKYNHFD